MLLIVVVDGCRLYVVDVSCSLFIVCCCVLFVACCCCILLLVASRVVACCCLFRVRCVLSVVC